MCQESKIAYEKVSIERAAVVGRVATAVRFAAANLGFRSPPEVVFVRPVEISIADSNLGARKAVGMEEAHPKWSRIPCSIPRDGGYTPGNPDLWEFWLMADIEEGSHHIEFAVLHECRHLWQRTKLPTVF